MTELRLALTTFSSPEEAAPILRCLVEEKLIACGTLLPGTRSIYAWEGKIEDSTETLALLKTTREGLPALQSRLLELHPYDTPEFLAFAPDTVSPAYAAWALNGVGSENAEEGDA